MSFAPHPDYSSAVAGVLPRPLSSVPHPNDVVYTGVLSTAACHHPSMYTNCIRALPVLLGDVQLDLRTAMDFVFCVLPRKAFHTLLGVPICQRCDTPHCTAHAVIADRFHTLARAVTQGEVPADLVRQVSELISSIFAHLLDCHPLAYAFYFINPCAIAKCIAGDTANRRGLLSEMCRLDRPDRVCTTLEILLDAIPDLKAASAQAQRRDFIGEFFAKPSQGRRGPVAYPLASKALRAYVVPMNPLVFPQTKGALIAPTAGELSALYVSTVAPPSSPIAKTKAPPGSPYEYYSLVSAGYDSARPLHAAYIHYFGEDGAYMWTGDSNTTPVLIFASRGVVLPVATIQATWSLADQKRIIKAFSCEALRVHLVDSHGRVVASKRPVLCTLAARCLVAAAAKDPSDAIGYAERIARAVCQAIDVAKFLTYATSVASCFRTLPFPSESQSLDLGRDPLVPLSVTFLSARQPDKGNLHAFVAALDAPASGTTYVTQDLEDIEANLVSIIDAIGSAYVCFQNLVKNHAAPYRIVPVIFPYVYALSPLSADAAAESYVHTQLSDTNAATIKAFFEAQMAPLMNTQPQDFAAQYPIVLANIIAMSILSQLPTSVVVPFQKIDGMETVTLSEEGTLLAEELAARALGDGDIIPATGRIPSEAIVRDAVAIATQALALTF